MKRGRGSIKECLAYYDASNAAAQEVLDKHLEEFKNRWLKTSRSYFKLRVANSTNLYLMFWSPNGYTRPHEHLYPDGYTGAPATIYVLRGGLVQEHFSIQEAHQYHLLSASDYWTSGEPMEEDENVLHRIGNASLKDWAISIHEFVPGFTMRVYEFSLNKKWIVSGRRDTLGPPPKDAEPIWPG